MPSNVTITPAQSARNLGIIFDSALSMSDHISSVSKSCFISIRDLRRIRNTLEFSTARTITIYLVHSKLDYCNSLFLNLPQSQLGRLQLILNSSARGVSKTPKFAHIIIMIINSIQFNLIQFLNLFTGSKLSSASNIIINNNLNVQSHWRSKNELNYNTSSHASEVGLCMVARDSSDVTKQV